MPKKRHFNRYSKPQSTAPSSLASSSSNTPAQDRRQNRGVNDLLATLRRTSVTPPGSAASFPAASPSVPPSIREILQLPETPAPLDRTRSRFRLDAQGRRLPAGPPPPRSWQVSSSRPREGGTAHASLHRAEGGDGARLLPGDYAPGAGSLVDMLLRLLVREWDSLGPVEDLGLWMLPDGVREGLLRYLDVYRGAGVTLADFKSILVARPLEGEEEEEDRTNAYFTHVHVPSSLLTTTTFPAIISVLFPKTRDIVEDEPQESWEEAALTVAPQGYLLPALTHLSLAITPGSSPSRAATPSWRHLLQLAKKMPGLTHLSLASWPEPSRTPHAKFASVVGPQGTSVQYGGTGMYSHSVDEDWSEAVNVLKALSRRLYKLEYLDVTGCGAWFPALVRETRVDDGEEGGGGVWEGVDWAGDWGKVEVVRMVSGLRITGEEGGGVRDGVRAAAAVAGELERRITAQRAGRGRIIRVERDDLYDLRG